MSTTLHHLQSCDTSADRSSADALSCGQRTTRHSPTMQRSAMRMRQSAMARVNSDSPGDVVEPEGHPVSHVHVPTAPRDACDTCDTIDMVTPTPTRTQRETTQSETWMGKTGRTLERRTSAHAANSIVGLSSEGASTTTHYHGPGRWSLALGFAAMLLSFLSTLTLTSAYDDCSFQEVHPRARPRPRPHKHKHKHKHERN